MYCLVSIFSSIANFCRIVFIHSVMCCLFSGALNNGYLYILEFETYSNRIVNLEQRYSIDLQCEIFGLAFCEINEYLLIATNVGLKGWDNSQRYYIFIIYNLFEIYISHSCNT